MLRATTSWLEAHQALALAAALVSGLIALGTAVAMPWIVASLPRDFFTSEAPIASRWAEHHPALRLLLRVGRNALGAALVVAGVAMLVLPGQGLLTMAVGVMLVQFPGKRRLELWIARRRRVWNALNWLRRRMGREPFEPQRTGGARDGGPA